MENNMYVDRVACSFCDDIQNCYSGTHIQQEKGKYCLNASCSHYESREYKCNMIRLENEYMKVHTNKEAVGEILKN